MMQGVWLQRAKKTTPATTENEEKRVRRRHAATHCVAEAKRVRRRHAATHCVAEEKRVRRRHAATHCVAEEKRRETSEETTCCDSQWRRRGLNQLTTHTFLHTSLTLNNTQATNTFRTICMSLTTCLSGDECGRCVEEYSLLSYCLDHS
jgi:hypothetical protein